jgi:hypothetical protein
MIKQVVRPKLYTADFPEAKKVSHSNAQPPEPSDSAASRQSAMIAPILHLYCPWASLHLRQDRELRAGQVQDDGALSSPRQPFCHSHLQSARKVRTWSLLWQHAAWLLPHSPDTIGMRQFKPRISPAPESQHASTWPLPQTDEVPLPLPVPWSPAGTSSDQHLKEG